jgi:quercetin dioxygenase-like cupin family protein
MKVTHGHAPGAPSDLRASTFVGTVWADPVLVDAGAPTVNTVFFTPGARTNWHTHEHGQLLLITHGSGYAQVKDGEGSELNAGDVVWFPPGELHWHGASSTTLMSHIAVSLGATDWLDPVEDEDYLRAQGGAPASAR